MSSDARTDSPSPAAAIGDPEKLLSAANDASGVARNTWLAFLGVLAYLIVTLGSVTHTDLLLNNPVRLPIVNVDVPLFGFFLIAPVLLLILYFNLLVQHALVAHKYFQFARAIAAYEKGNPSAESTDTSPERADLRSHPDRFLVHNYVFAQLLAGPQRPRAIERMMRAMIWLTISALPIVILLYFQIKFLAYHSEYATLLHQIALIVALLMLLLIRAYFLYPHLIEEHGTKFATALNYMRQGEWSRTKWSPLFVSEDRTEPGLYWPWHPGISNFTRSLILSSLLILFSILVATVPGSNWDRRMSGLGPLAANVKTGTGDDRSVFFLTKLLFDQGWFARNLDVSNVDLVPNRSWEPEESSIPLQVRHLEYANLAGSDFHRVDLRNASLQGAQLDGADLRGAVLQNASLQSADLRSTKLQGANLSGAYLQGAEMFQASLQGADLKNADLRGADLGYANLQGADMGGADLQGANLTGANVQAADLTNARIACADLRYAKVWFAKPPVESSVENDCSMMADVNTIILDEPGKDFRNNLKEVLADLKNMEAVQLRVAKRLALLNINEESAKPEEWAEINLWSELKNQPRPGDYKTQLSDALATFACKNYNKDMDAVGGLIRRSKSSFNGNSTEFGRILSELIQRNECPDRPSASPADPSFGSRGAP